MRYKRPRSLIENIQKKINYSLEETTAFRAYVSYNGWASIAELAELAYDRRV